MTKKHKISIILLLTIFLIEIMSSGVYAYFTTYTEAKGEYSIDLALPKCTVTKRKTNNTTYAKINNISTVSCYVRMKICVPSNTKINVKSDNIKWYEYNGYWYYSDMLKSGASTNELEIEVEGDKTLITIGECTEVAYNDVSKTTYGDWGNKGKLASTITKRLDKRYLSSSSITLGGIGVALQENGKNISWRSYDYVNWDEQQGTLFEDLLKEEMLFTGKTYEQKVASKNIGGIDQYVRASVYRYWVDKDGRKATEVSPNDIELVFGEGWIEDAESRTAERSVLYYPYIVNSGATTSNLLEGIKLSDNVRTSFEHKERKTDTGATIITSTRKYQDLKFVIEVKVDAVQTHNAEDAIESAWGRKVKITNGILSLK